MGLTVEINDEGEYWPGRDEAALRLNVGQMNGAIAGAAGAMKDAAGDDSIQSPIFAHPQFEHLEAEGAASVQPLRKAVELMAKQGRSQP